jgi:leucyl aminopeptidase
MTTKIDKILQIPNNSNMILLVGDPSKLTNDILSSDEIGYIKTQNEKNKTQSFAFNRLQYWVFVKILKKEEQDYKSWENCRKAGDDLQKEANHLKLESLVLKGVEVSPIALISLAEGLVLGNYQFVKYFKDATEKSNTLKDIFIFSDEIPQAEIDRQNILLDAVCHCRELVNEPVMQLNAVKLAENFAEMGKEAGIKVEILNKRKIESLKMGGLLAVNKGSVDPPTFTVMEWKPENAINEKPIVLVGKGVVYDTGGLNIKTGKFMETMKHDMAGAAMMASVIFAVARLNLPVYLVALMPATDNRPNGNAYASGDVIKMHNGLSVEVINTDAEGRLILADALSYAQKIQPTISF